MGKAAAGDQAERAGWQVHNPGWEPGRCSYPSICGEAGGEGALGKVQVPAPETRGEPAVTPTLKELSHRLESRQRRPREEGDTM